MGLRKETVYKVNGRSYKSFDRALKSAAETIACNLLNFDFGGVNHLESLGSVRRLENNNWSEAKESKWLERVEAKALRRLKRLYSA